MISVRHLSKSFQGEAFKKKKSILKDVSFEIPRGVATGFVGANGSGKTTTLKCILQFLKPDSGEILFSGKPLSIETKNKIGYLPERPYLYEYLTETEFLKMHWDLGLCASHKLGFAPALSSPETFAQAKERVLETVGLKTHHQKIRSFSKGMMQRLGLAQALLHQPELLILDEPMSGLDPDGRWLVKEIIKKEVQKGTTVFFSSHLLSDMQSLCEFLVAMDGGEIICCGKISEFLSRAGAPDRPDLEEAFIQKQREHRDQLQAQQDQKAQR